MFRIPKKGEPIIDSLFQTDFYKFPMGQMIYHKHPNTIVQYEMTNRSTEVLLAEHIDIGELKEQLDHVMTLSPENSKVKALRGTNEYGNKMFEEDYLDFFEHKMKLPQYYLEKRKDGQLRLGSIGPWADVMNWEIYMLTIVTSLYMRNLLKGYSQFEIDAIFAKAILKLQEKIKKLQAAIAAGIPISFSDFSTRRAAFPFWQDYIVEVLSEIFPDDVFRGTSNVFLAYKHNVMAMGTNAHEIMMVYRVLFDSLMVSQKQALTDWESEFGLGLYIALSDTYSSDYFNQYIITPEQAATWKGFRQDSGDPFIFGEKTIRFYESLGIDPRTKLIVFSDGLDVDTIIKLASFFKGRIMTTFGWGTNLANDIGFKPLSLVVKAIKADGKGLVKLSDNIAKAIGKPTDIEKVKREVGYHEKFFVTPTY